MRAPYSRYREYGREGVKSELEGRVNLKMRFAVALFSFWGKSLNIFVLKPLTSSRKYRIDSGYAAIVIHKGNKLISIITA